MEQHCTAGTIFRPFLTEEETETFGACVLGTGGTANTLISELEFPNSSVLSRSYTLNHYLSLSDVQLNFVVSETISEM